MFNTYVDNKFNYNVNAVSGTLRKTMKESKFIIRKLDSDLCIFDPECQSICWNTNPIVHLQIMLIGDNKCLIEYVEKDIFDKIMSNSENDSVEQENGIVWHNLKTNPEDLPKVDRLVRVRLMSGMEHICETCYYEPSENEIIAWCELPRFNKELIK